jgi:hypothetical protein
LWAFILGPFPPQYLWREDPGAGVFASLREFRQKFIKFCDGPPIWHSEFSPPVSLPVPSADANICVACPNCGELRKLIIKHSIFVLY